MKKKKYLSLILPLIYFLPSAVIVYYCITDGIIEILFNGGEMISSLVLLSFTPLCLLIGSFISIWLIAKHELHIGKYIPSYIATVILSVIVTVISWFVSFETYNEWLPIWIPAIMAVIIIIFYCHKTKDARECGVMILTSPIIYYLILMVCFAIDLSIHGFF